MDKKQAQAINAINDVMNFMGTHCQYDSRNLGLLERKTIFEIRGMLVNARINHGESLDENALIFLRSAILICDDIIDEIPRHYDMAIYNLYSTIFMVIHISMHRG